MGQVKGMCFRCPAHLAINHHGCTLRVVRIADTVVAPEDVAHSEADLSQFQAGNRFLVALQATVYVENRPVLTEELHGVVESDLPGELPCAFENRAAMECLLRMVHTSINSLGHLRHLHRVLY